MLLLVSLPEVLGAQAVNDQTPGYFPFAVPSLDNSPTAVDLSWMNPTAAGAEGRITVSDGHFVDSHGQRIRFFGTNVCFEAAMPPKGIAPTVAAHLRRMGFNIIRMHHMDTVDSPRGLLKADKVTLDPVMLDRMEFFVAELEKSGIYINMNLHVGRSYPGLPENLDRRFVYGKGLDRFHRPLIELQKEFARDLLTHVNPYTGRSLAQDPAVVVVEMNNENSILTAKPEQYDALPDPYRADLLDQWHAWLAKKYSSDEALRTAWDADSSAPLTRETAPIPAKAVATDTKLHDFKRFLYETECATAAEIRRYVKEDLAVGSLIVDSQASWGELGGVYRETKVADVIDAHSYWQLQQWTKTPWDLENWTFPNEPLSGATNGGTLNRLGRHRVLGMPFTVSEYNHPAPSIHALQALPMLSTFGSFQDWDGFYQFTYKNDGKNWEPDKLDFFHNLDGNSGQLVFVPFAAIALRNGYFTTKSEPIALELPADDSFLDTLDKWNVNMELWNSVKDAPNLPVFAPIGIRFTDKTKVARFDIPASVDVKQDPAKALPIGWDIEKGIYTAVSDQAVALVGAVADSTERQLGPLRLTIEPTFRKHAVFTAVALDGQPLSQSGKILISLANRVENSNMGWYEKFTTVGNKWGEAPIVAEGITARIHLSTNRSLKAFALDGTGAPKATLNVEGDKDLSFQITPEHESLWFLLQDPSASTRPVN